MRNVCEYSARPGVCAKVVAGVCAALAFAVAPAGALTKYVTPTGAGGFTGADWDNAYSSIPQAVSACAGVVSTIYVKYGNYTNSAQIAVTNHPGLTLSGGYLGTIGETPGGKTSSPTIITRDSSSIRIFYCTNSTISFDTLTVSNGYLGNGAGIYLEACAATLTNCTLAKNGTIADATGGGIYVKQGTLTVMDSTFRDNAYPRNGYGGAIYGDNVVLTLLRTTFSGNILGTGYVGAWRYGGALWLSGGSAQIRECNFLTNGLNYDWITLGGAIYAASVNPLIISNTAFVGNFAVGHPDTQSPKGSALYLGSGVNAELWGCTFSGGNGGGYLVCDIWSDTAGSVGIYNTRIASGQGCGIYKPGSGSMMVSNCLVNNNVQDGIRPAAGTVIVANSTLADNGGWGLTNRGATAVTLKDSILWGNAAGGWAGSGVGAIYTDSQEAHGGAGNICADPLFVAGYFLSSNGLPFQAASSPCLDVGSDTAANLGLNACFATTEGQGDAGQVDLGYHSTSNFSSAVSNLLLYVNANPPGDDSNDGWTPGTALKTISRALNRAVDGSVIYVATGTYNSVLAESFPLVFPCDRIRLIGAERVATIVDPAATNRAFQALNKSGLWLDGLTVINGLAPYDGSSRRGSALWLTLGSATITNCAMIRNGTLASPIGGGAIYVNGYGSSVNIYNSTLVSNGMNAAYSSGGAICAQSANIILDGTSLEWNRIVGYDYAAGGVLWMSGGSLQLRNCRISNNSTEGYHDSGLLHLSYLSGLAVSNCVFAGNYVRTWTIAGVISVFGNGVNGMQIVDCVFSNNPSLNPSGQIALNLSGGTLLVKDCILLHNAGNGIYKAGTAALGVTNCIIHAHTNSGIYLASGAASVGNSILSDNLLWGATNNSGAMRIYNSILWSNTVGIAANCTVDYCDTYPALGGGDHNISAFPRYVDVANDDFHVYNSSPCLNRGTNEPWMETGFDLDGRKRLLQGCVDIGPYEVMGSGGVCVFIR